MEKINESHMRSLYLKFSSIYGKKFTHDFESEEMRDVWYSTWTEGLEGISLDHAKKAVNQCMVNLKWPPSLAEFRSICDSISGIPNEMSVMRSLIRGEFDHPLVDLCYEEIGSWSISNLKERELFEKVKEIYPGCMNNLRRNLPKLTQDKRSKHNRYPTSGLNEKLSVSEISMFKKNLSNWRENSKKNLEEKMKSDQKHPEWDLSKCNPYSYDFDKELYNKRRDYLLSVSWEDSVTLNHDDKYDRIRFIGENQGREMINNNSFFNKRGYSSNPIKVREKFEYK